jgi:hypothetical protein
MKRLSIVLVAILLIVAGCQTAPSAKESPDDLVTSPGGILYRANFHETGVTNPWPAIQGTIVDLSDNVTVSYRSYIETKAGETRNNIVSIRHVTSSQFPNVSLTINKVTVGIEINQSGGGGFPGNTETVVAINILKNVTPGEYTVDIGLVVDGKDYGKLPCTINVTK